MLYAKRNSLTSLKTLGPPLRATHNEVGNDTLPVEECDVARTMRHEDRSQAPPESAGPLTSFPSSVLRAVENRGNTNDKENATPFTLKVTAHTYRGTPNSTYPNSNNVVVRSSAAKEKGGQRSTVGTPSSTFPISVISQEDATLTSGTNHHPAQDAHISKTTASNHPYNGTPQFHSTNTDGMLLSRSKSVPKQLCTVSKPPLDGHHSQQKLAPTIKQALVVKQHKEEMSSNGVAVGCSNPLGPLKPLVLSPPEEEQNVVVLRSGDREKRFKRVKVIGCGGSSKVRDKVM